MLWTELWRVGALQRTYTWHTPSNQCEFDASVIAMSNCQHRDPQTPRESYQNAFHTCTRGRHSFSRGHPLEPLYTHGWTHKTRTGGTPS